jgi:U11/U12 small nuclear ribonucleoprotein SNRNP65
MDAQFSRHQWPQQQPGESQEGEPQRVVSTLLVKHLPEALPAETLMRLFSHYGASAVRPCVAGRLKNCAFVDFKDEGVAARAESQLNRLRFLGKILLVERAKPLSGNQNKDLNKTEYGQQAPPLTNYGLTKENEQLAGDATTKGASQGSIFVGEPIAPRLGVDYPFPPHLEYAYPPPDGNILTNIVNALIAVPRFYTQVLHLMNKMNLPAPFRPALPTPPLPPPLPTAPIPAAPRPQVGDVSSDESELESSDEGELDNRKDTTRVSSVVELEKRKLNSARKRPKLEGIVGSALDKGTSYEAAGAKPISLLPKEVPIIKKKQPVLQVTISAH